MSDLTSLENVKLWLRISTDRAITGISNANPGVVACPAHGLPNNWKTIISGVQGMTELNGQTITVTVISDDSFSIGIDTSAFGEYAGGGFVGMDDVILSRLIAAVSKLIEQELNRTFAVQAYTDIRNGDGSRELLLRNYPVTAVDSVAVNGEVIPPEPEEGGDGWLLESSTVYLTGYTFARGYRNVKAVYQSGYETVPDDVEQAAISLVARKYKEMDRIGQASKSIDGATVSYLVNDMRGEIQTILANYWRPSIS